MLFKPIFDMPGRKVRAFCGPTAIAILTGVPLSRIEKMIRRVRGRQWGYTTDGRKVPIKGTYNWEVRKVLSRLGCKVEEFKPREPTLGRFVEDVRAAGTFLINVTGHYMVCSNGQVADSTYPDSVPIETYHKPTRKVVLAWRVVAPALPKYGPDDSLVATRAPRPKKDVKLVRLEKALKDVKRWERKEKLAKTKLKKLRAAVKRYQKLGLSLD